MAIHRHAILVLGLVLAMAGCRADETPGTAAPDPHGVLSEKALTEGDRVCAGPEGDLLASGLIVAHADGNMHRVGECTDPLRPLYVHERQVDADPADQAIFVRVAEDRYLRLRPARDGETP